MKKRKLYTTLFFGIFICGIISAEEPWYDYALRANIGYVENAATLDAHGIYGKARLGSGAEYGAAFVIVMNKNFDIDIGLTRMSADGRQRAASGAGKAGEYMDINLTLTKLLITGKWRSHKYDGMFIPWIGGGLQAGMISSDESEHTFVGGGYLIYERTRASSALGAHIATGIDIYPVKTASLALTLEARYQINPIINGPLKGDLDSASFIAGVKWDFWPGTSYKFKKMTR